MRSAAILGFVALAGCTAQAQAERAQSPSAQIEVTDGDTIRLGKERIRLSNIDAPELPPGSKCWAEAALSLAASRELEALIARAPSLEIEREGRDRYGRTLARLRSGDSDIGETLVNLGLAAKWTGRKWDWCGPADYTNAAGPGLSSGPEGNAGYMRWAGEQWGWRVKRDLAPVLGDAEPGSGRASTPGR